MWASLVAQMVNNLHGVQETWVQALGKEDPLEKGMAIHSSILVWRIPWTEEPGRLRSIGSQRVGHNLTTNTHTHICFEGGALNNRDAGPKQATVQKERQEISSISCNLYYDTERNEINSVRKQSIYPLRLLPNIKVSNLWYILNQKNIKYLFSK